MSACIHCGTPFRPVTEKDTFCCKGCEFVHGLILDDGLDRFYTLRGDAMVKPARSVPFEAHDFSGVEKKVRETEAGMDKGMIAEGGFSLEGISCVGCVWLVEKVFARQPGAIEAVADSAGGRVHLKWTAGETNVAEFAKELASFGYTLGTDGKTENESRFLAARLGLCGAFVMNAMAFTLPFYLGMPEDFAFARIFQLITFLTATLSMLVGGSYFIGRAWKAVRSGVLHIDLPIALGLLLAFAGSIAGWIMGMKSLFYFDFVSMFVFLMLGGRYFQLSALEKNHRRLRSKRPVPETLRLAGEDKTIALGELEPGMRFELLPGQSAPVAGTLDSESADFSLEWINGEAEAKTYRAGRAVPAGAIHLGKEAAVLTAEERWEESLLAKLVEGGRRTVRVPGLERLLKIYLLAVLVAGVAAFAWWISHGPVAPALQVMISIFVVSCPCALGVAIPLADELAGSAMERMGVFIREPLVWSRLNKVRKLLLDKTGTLTLERPVPANPEAISSLDDEARLALARLTSGSLHPVSRTLLEALGREGQRILREHPMPEVTDVPGTGRHFTENGVRWSLGRPPEGSAHDAELCRNGETAACFRFHESLRPDAIGALESLRRLGLRLVILSGDRREKVAAAAKRLGIPMEDAHAELRPEEKETLVRGLDRHDTLYLGDGANDSLAFDAAWVTGTPVVDRSLLETKADFYFMGQGLRFLPLMLDLAVRRKRAVRRAFGFALIYNFCVVGIAMAGHMNPLAAAVLMPLSSAISLAIVAAGLKERTFAARPSMHASRHAPAMCLPH